MVKGNPKLLKELKRRISKHFYNEAEIMKDILESNLTPDESRELTNFIKRHPFAELSTYVQELRRQKASTSLT